MNLEIKEEGDMELVIKDNNRAVRKNRKKWVSVESILNLFTSRCKICKEVTFTDKPEKETICTDCEKTKVLNDEL